jgi:hypothetical protein
MILVNDFLLRRGLVRIKLAVSQSIEVLECHIHRFKKGDLAMTLLRPVLLISLLALTASAQSLSRQKVSIPSSCPVTVTPPTPFVPPPQYELDDYSSAFWIGTDKLWTALRKTGVWYWAPHPPGHENDVQPLTEKTFWGSVDFDYKTEYPPALKVTGRRLDGDAPPLLTLRSTNAFPGPAVAMLSGVRVPTPGCWEITGEYKGEKLSFVVWVQAVKQAISLE